MKILIINGPNLNLTGLREPGIYGSETMDSIIAALRAECARQWPDVELDYFQSNHEGAIIDRIHASRGEADGIVLNAGAYSHTSLAIADAIASVPTPVVEVHMSNIAAREPIRRQSLTAPVCVGVIAGFGARSYSLGVAALVGHINQTN